jgi:hypothetical protein
MAKAVVEIERSLFMTSPSVCPCAMRMEFDTSAFQARHVPQVAAFQDAESAGGHAVRRASCLFFGRKSMLPDNDAAA